MDLRKNQNRQSNVEEIGWESEYDYNLFLKIEDVRMMYDHICYSLQMWPGSPARPAEEQEYLLKLKMQLFAMLAEYTLENG